MKVACAAANVYEWVNIRCTVNSHKVPNVVSITCQQGQDQGVFQPAVQQKEKSIISGVPLIWVARSYTSWQLSRPVGLINKPLIPLVRAKCRAPRLAFWTCNVLSEFLHDWQATVCGLATRHPANYRTPKTVHKLLIFGINLGSKKCDNTNIQITPFSP